MRILLTNDDGIHAEGLQVLYEIALTLTGNADDIWIVAPNSEKSGVGHCISLSSPVLLSQLDAKRYSVEGNPADC
ncbi:MAG: 5'/3'-nucleotidase SurE, partial [Paracoccaceae bacterium]